jgi:N-acetylneuraminic acid mutarotase
MNVRRSELGAAVIDGKVYAVGGLTVDEVALNTLEIYDPATDQWSRGPALPMPRHHAGVAAVDGKLYVLGGFMPSDYPWEASNSVQVFDPATSTWTQRNWMPVPRAAFTASVVGGKIYCIGGHEGRLNQAYDPATDTWETLPELPTRREHLASASLGTSILVIGGRVTTNPNNFGGTTTNRATLEAYDTETRAWTQLPAMPTPRGGLGAAVLGGKLYAIGGEFPGVYRDVEEYDPATRAWRAMRHMATPRHGIATVAVDGRIYVIGGGTRFGFSDTPVNEAFTPAP